MVIQKIFETYLKNTLTDQAIIILNAITKELIKLIVNQ